MKLWGKIKMGNWLKEKITITLTRKEMFELSNVMAENDTSDFEFMQSKDRRVRKIFRKNFKQRHKLWLKITKTAEREKVLGVEG